MSDIERPTLDELISGIIALAAVWPLTTDQHERNAIATARAVLSRWVAARRAH